MIVYAYTKQKGVRHGYNRSRNLSYLYNYGISDSDTRHVTGKENGIGSVDENGKQKECQTCKNRKYVDGSDEANVSFKSAAHVSKKDLKVTDGIKAREDHVDMQV